MNVFVSSVVEGLKEERDKVKEVLNQMGYEVFLSEQSGAHPQTSIETCLREIEKCDIFVSIISERYGAVPDRFGNGEIFDGTTSFSKGELEHASKLTKPILVYKKKIPENTIEPMQLKFIKQIKDEARGYFIYEFTSSSDLTDSLKTDITRTITELIRGTYCRPHFAPIGKIIICKDSLELFQTGAKYMWDAITGHDYPVIGLSSGSTVRGVYNAFVEKYSKEIAQNYKDRLLSSKWFNDMESFGVSPGHHCSRRSLLEEILFRKLEERCNVTFDREQNIHYLPSVVEQGDIGSMCLEYDAILRTHSIDLKLLGIAPNGQFIGIDPGIIKTIPELLTMNTKVLQIGSETFDYLDPRPVLPYVVTMGFGNVYRLSKTILMLAYGGIKANIIRKMIWEDVIEAIPATVLKTHQKFILAIDEDAISKLPFGWRKRYEVVEAGKELTK